MADGAERKGFLRAGLLIFAPLLLYAVLYPLLELPFFRGTLDPWLRGLGSESRVLLSFLSFLVLPAMLLLILNKRPILWEAGRSWLPPFIFYLLVFALASVFYYLRPAFYSGFRYDIPSPEFLGYSVFLALRVFPVDFFTKRIVQGESEGLLGPAAGQALQTLAWLVAHIYEIFWLRPLWGTTGALLFIISTGIVSGYIYHKGGSVSAFMLFHWAMNIGVVLLVSF